MIIVGFRDSVLFSLLPIRFVWPTVFHLSLQFHFLPSLHFLSFFVFFCTHTFSQNWPSWSTTTLRQPRKGQKLFQLILLRVALKHCYNQKYATFIYLSLFPLYRCVTECLWYFHYPILNLKACNILTVWGRSRTTRAAGQQGATTAEHWLCNWYVSRPVMAYRQGMMNTEFFWIWNEDCLLGGKDYKIHGTRIHDAIGKI